MIPDPCDFRIRLNAVYAFTRGLHCAQAVQPRWLRRDKSGRE